MTGEGVEQIAVGAGIDKCAIVVLAVDFDQRTADVAHQRDGGLLIVDKDARAPVARLQAAQDDVAVVLDGVLGQDFARRMVARHVEHRRHLPLGGTVAHQRGIAARAERQRQRIEKDGFAGARFAGQNGKPRREIDVEPFDQDDIANR